MASLTTIALLEKRADISGDLFSRYWRDVHGVMAARIPGFGDYVQYHVSLAGGDTGNLTLSGIAVVGFESEAKRAGLAESPIVPEIVRDEPNLFGRVMLLNLAPENTTVLNPGSASDLDSAIFLLFTDGITASHWTSEQAANGSEVHLHDISAADPSLWNGIDATTKCWSHVVICWPNGASLEPVPPHNAIYRTDARYALVENGRPTPVGLRGAGALKTILEAGASNQLEHQVEDLIFASPSTR